eukprot:scaffold3978_cov61-Phaeocystis_antarctica.AAC.5
MPAVIYDNIKRAAGLPHPPLHRRRIALVAENGVDPFEPARLPSVCGALLPEVRLPDLRLREQLEPELGVAAPRARPSRSCGVATEPNFEELDRRGSVAQRHQELAVYGLVGVQSCHLIRAMVHPT